MVHNLPEKGKKSGGVPISVSRIAEELGSRAELDVTVGCISGDQAEGFAVWRPIKSTWLVRLCANPIGILVLYPVLLNFVKFPKADVIHFHGEDWFLFRKKKAIVIRTFHGSSKLEMAHTENLLRKCYLGCAGILEGLSAKLAAGVLCVGTETQAIFSSDYYIGNGFSKNCFFPAEKQQRPVVFYNGYWAGRKRGQFAYSVFIEKVLPEMPDAELWFLSDFCSAHSSVKHFRGVTDERLGELYRESWVFLYPSTYEGFGMAYIEAMASGTAIVASDNAGARDVLLDGKYGVICDDAELGREVVRLLRDSRARLRLEMDGLKRSENYTIEKIADDHLAFYQRTLKLCQ